MSDLRSPKVLSETPDSVAVLKPIAIGESDRRAGKLIMHLVDEILPEDATVGDAEEVVTAALWWLQTWASNSKAARAKRKAR